MNDILSQIVEHKRHELAAARAALPEQELRARLADAPTVRDFLGGLVCEEAVCNPSGVALIAEIKRASPSAGLLRPDFDPVRIAGIYQQHGAQCLSVLTDTKFFQGCLDDLRNVRAAVGLPVLRKDFVLDSYQVLEARVAGADAVLLIAECLDNCQLRKLLAEVEELGMTALVELYEPENLQRVIDAGATLVGINNRDLRTFRTDLEHVVRLSESVPDECVLVAESGIRTHEDVERLCNAGIDAMLVGETLMRSEDIGAAVDMLLGR